MESYRQKDARGTGCLFGIMSRNSTKLPEYVASRWVRGVHQVQGEVTRMENQIENKIVHEAATGVGGVVYPKP